jgi:uncharacterized protein YjbI with pentapeptide repeats
MFNPQKIGLAILINDPILAFWGIYELIRRNLVILTISLVNIFIWSIILIVLPAEISDQTTEHISNILNTMAQIQATVLGIFVSVFFLIVLQNIKIVPAGSLRKWFFTDLFFGVIILLLASIFLDIILLSIPYNELIITTSLVFSLTSLELLVLYIYRSIHDLLKKTIVEELRIGCQRQDLRYLNLPDEPENVKKLKVNNVNLNHSNFSNSSLEDSIFKDSNINFALFTNSNLSSCQFIRCNLIGTNFNYAKMRNVFFASQTALDNTFFFGADLQRATMNECLLINSVLSMAKLNKALLSGTTLVNAKLWKADLRQARINKAASLMDADLQYANLEKADLTSATFIRANLKNANLKSANLENTALNNADLTDANFENANLINADLTSTKLNNAVFRNSNLSGTIFKEIELNDKCLRSLIGAKNLDKAIFDDNIKNKLINIKKGL